MNFEADNFNNQFYFIENEGYAKEKNWMITPVKKLYRCKREAPYVYNDVK